MIHSSAAVPGPDDATAYFNRGLGHVAEVNSGKALGAFPVAARADIGKDRRHAEALVRVAEIEKKLANGEPAQRQLLNAPESARAFFLDTTRTHGMSKRRRWFALRLIA